MKTITKRLFLIITMFILFSTLFCETIAEVPTNYNDDNAGTAENPFLISNLSNLRWLSENEEYWGFPTYEKPEITRYFFLQTADIDAFATREWNEGKGFSVIGHHNYYQALYTDRPFCGVYDGANYTITDLFIATLVYRTSSYGMFSYTEEAIIKNLHLQNLHINIKESINAVGGLVGRIGRNSSIINCSTTGNINVIVDRPFLSSLGGLVGSSMLSTIENCFSKVHFDVDLQYVDFLWTTIGIAGLVGSLGYSTLKNSFFIGSLPIDEDTVVET